MDDNRRGHFDPIRLIDELIEDGVRLPRPKFEHYSSPPNNDFIAKYNGWVLKSNGLIKSLDYKDFLLDECPISLSHLDNMMIFPEFVDLLIKSNLQKLVNLKDGIQKKYFFSLKQKFFESFSEDLLDQAKELLDKGFEIGAIVYCRLVIDLTLSEVLKYYDLTSRKSAPGSKLQEIYRSKKIDKGSKQFIETIISTGNDAAHKGIVPDNDTISKIIKETRYYRDLLINQIGGINSENT